MGGVLGGVALETLVHQVVRTPQPFDGVGGAAHLVLQVRRHVREVLGACAAAQEVTHVLAHDNEHFRW